MVPSIEAASSIGTKTGSARQTSPGSRPQNEGKGGRKQWATFEHGHTAHDESQPVPTLRSWAHRGPSREYLRL
ncbi:hypothetical protein SCP_1403280 [Sparassis crispa]|uniref:Uncharacterized protein n=1 Tax=Sparassis crispa TaxID=139825 RepID=A0A401H3J6_9APHY|nr:hypothetical protein SCP_1403280 [Sparassis crispa]GBE88920.1 hypothetical protein SCP_1403280 [Sparassis crispa]